MSVNHVDVFKQYLSNLADTGCLSVIVPQESSYATQSFGRKMKQDQYLKKEGNYNLFNLEI